MPSKTFGDVNLYELAALATAQVVVVGCVRYG